jgi:hypothetical protein
MERTTKVEMPEDEFEAALQHAMERALEEVDVDALRHTQRLETGTCYTQDLAWMWDLSKDAILDRLEAAGVEPTSTGGRRHLWDVDEAVTAIQEY